ncbi:hypothetical protein ILYODFUR_037910 [Ilyodon furcidens]|uniref:Uncharacterized protein n=1 Tax=Ilyodon furcidens TaxID=33524 RepID=A0ABV0T3J9_9TELE
MELHLSENKYCNLAQVISEDRIQPGGIKNPNHIVQHDYTGKAFAQLLPVGEPKSLSHAPNREIGQTESRRDLKFGTLVELLKPRKKVSWGRCDWGTNMVFAPKVKKCNNFPNGTPKHTKVGMKEDLWVTDEPMG